MKFNQNGEFLVTVVVPAFNSTKTIFRALDSLRAQTFRDFRVIVVDDGSSDGTFEAVQDFSRASKFPSIHIERTENLGASHARNLGVALSKTPLVAFLDADDKWMSAKLERQVHGLMDRDDLIGVTCQYFMVESGSERTNQVQTFYWDETDLQSWTVFGRRAPAMNSTLLLRTEVFREVGGFDDKLNSYAEDLDLAWRLRALGLLEQIDECLVEVYCSDTQTHRNLEGMSFGLKQVYEKLETVRPKLASMADHGLSLRSLMQDLENSRRLQPFLHALQNTIAHPILSARILSLLCRTKLRITRRS